MLTCAMSDLLGVGQGRSQLALFPTAPLTTKRGSHDTKASCCQSIRSKVIHRSRPTSKTKATSNARLECSLSTISCKPFITSSAFSAVAFTASVMKWSRKAQAAKAEASERLEIQQSTGAKDIWNSGQPAFEGSLVPGITMMVSVRFGSREPSRCKKPK